MPAGEPLASPAELSLGQRLFSETRFAHYYFVHSAGNVNASLAVSDPTLAPLNRRATLPPQAEARFPGQAMSCRACHFSDELRNVDGLPARGVSAFADHAQRSPLPDRGDGRVSTARNSPSLIDAVPVTAGPGLMHYDAEFATVADLVKETYLGRNFGWLPHEHAQAKAHFARVIREDTARDEQAGAYSGFPYSVVLRGTDPAIPGTLRLPERVRFDPARASDDEILDRCTQLVVAFLRSLRFSRDADDLHDGSPYDAFLAANRLPRAPRPDESPAEYSRRLGELIAALRVPQFVDEPGMRLLDHEQAFRFGEAELQGMRIFFRAAISPSQMSGAGNCAECHVPPIFTDFKFHNTGATQDEYDALHHEGAFAQLEVPDAVVRREDHDRWLPPTSQHPVARGYFLWPATVEFPSRTDLGLWNVYSNPDLPVPQPALERLLNPDGRLAANEVLARAIARFKTATVRNLGQSAPYMHTGRLRTLDETVVFYQRMTASARAGKLRNAPPEFFAMRLAPADIGPLTAFLRALNEDFGPSRAGRNLPDAAGNRE